MRHKECREKVRQTEINIPGPYFVAGYTSMTEAMTQGPDDEFGKINKIKENEFIEINMGMPFSSLTSCYRAFHRVLPDVENVAIWITQIRSRAALFNRDPKELEKLPVLVIDSGVLHKAAYGPERSKRHGTN